MPHSVPVRTALPTGRGRLFRIAVACAVALGVMVYVALSVIFGDGNGARCTVRAVDGKGAGDSGGGYSLKPEAAANAAAIAAVAARRGLPERAVTIALATAMQESGLRNIGHGDRDSVGLFQQRPSQGWGTERQIQDPVYSADRFYDHLVKVPGYSRLPLTVAAQRVQRSGYPQAYAKHEEDASLLTSALTGRRAAALSCTTGNGNGSGSGSGYGYGGGSDDGQEPGDPERVRAQLLRQFGEDVLSPGPDGRDRIRASAGTAARSGVPAGAGKQAVRPSLTIPAHGERRGWELAHWAVANASGLRIEQIAYQGRMWSADRAGDGWRGPGTSGAGPDGPGDSGGTADAKSGGQTVVLRLATDR